MGISGINAYIKLPNTIERFSQAGAPVPVISKNSNKLTYILISNISNIEMWKNGFFATLKNATSLESLIMERMSSINFTKISDYIDYEMPSVTKLRISGNYASIINSLDGIDKFPNIRYFYLTNNEVKLNINGIKACKKLIYIDMSNSNIQSVNGLEELTYLQTLYLQNNNISSLKPLENLTNLELLNISNNSISDTSNYVDSNGTTKAYKNLEILANLNKNGKLRYLYLSGNDNIINWSPLSNLKWTDKSGW